MVWNKLKMSFWNWTWKNYFKMEEGGRWKSKLFDCILWLGIKVFSNVFCYVLVSLLFSRPKQIPSLWPIFGVRGLYRVLLSCAHWQLFDWKTRITWNKTSENWFWVESSQKLFLTAKFNAYFNLFQNNPDSAINRQQMINSTEKMTESVIQFEQKRLGDVRTTLLEYARFEMNFAAKCLEQWSQVFLITLILT